VINAQDDSTTIKAGIHIAVRTASVYRP